MILHALLVYVLALPLAVYLRNRRDILWKIIVLGATLTVLTMANPELSAMAFSYTLAFFTVYLAKYRPRLTMWPYIIILGVILWGIALSPIKAQEVGPEVDIIVTYVNSDGFVIQAKDGQQVVGNLLVTVYVSKPAVVTLTATVGAEKIAEYSETVDFKASWPINVPESKYNYILTLTIQVQSGAITKTYTKSFTVVKRPIPPATKISNLLAPSQVIEMLREAKWSTVMYAIIFTLAGLFAAIIMKYKMMILEPLNFFQVIFIGAASTIAMYLDPELGAGYIMLFILADIITYKFLEGPEKIEVLEFDTKNRAVWWYELPTYVTKAGRLAVALQETKEALRRLLGQHVYLNMDAEGVSYWKLNNEHSLILAEKAEIKEKTVSEEEPESTEASGTLFAIRKKVKTRLREFRVKLFDAMKLDFLREYRTFEKLLEDSKRAWQKVKELEKELEIRQIKAEARALEELINMLRPRGEE